MNAKLKNWEMNLILKVLANVLSMDKLLTILYTRLHINKDF